MNSEEKLKIFAETEFFRYIKSANSYYYEVFCPVCKSWFAGSKYLLDEIDDPKILFLANLVSHGRHGHFRHKEPLTQLEENEHVKRFYAAQVPGWLLSHGFTSEDIAKVRGTTPATIGYWDYKLRPDAVPEVAETQETQA